jgi:COMPASS component SWD3
MVEAFDIESGNPLYKFTEGQSRFVNCLAFSANGKIAATGGKDGSVRLWDIKPNAANVAAGGDWSLFNKVGIGDLALTPDGALLFAGSEKGEIKIAKVQGREILHTIQAHKGGVAACIVSPDGKHFATVGGDFVVKAWSSDGKELRSWNFGGRDSVFIINLAFSADSRQIVTANANTTVYVLDLP